MAKRSNCLIINMDLNELVLGVVGENLRAYTVWLVIYRHAHATDGFAWPSFDTIAKSAKLPNKRNLRRYLAVLEKLGLLDVIRNGKKWGYSIPVQYRQAVYGKRKKNGQQ